MPLDINDSNTMAIMDLSAVHMVKNKKDSATTNTPTTSASSSPALSSTTPNEDVMCFEELDVSSCKEKIPIHDYNDDDNNNNGANEETRHSSCWVAPASKKSLRTHNPIRAIVDPIMASSIKSGVERGDGKDQISLALGDPTSYGNLTPCPAIISAITRAVQCPNSTTAGYVNACGMPQAREAIAKYHSHQLPKAEVCTISYTHKVSMDDVIIANGASGALELALTALLDEDSVLLVPRPGFPLYQVIAESHGATVEYYDLLPDKAWEVDLAQMESIILGKEEEQCTNDNRKVVRAILVNNPSNPTGAVYSEQHLMKICQLAEKYQIPIISDEIYGDMVFGSHVFHPMAAIAAKLGYSVPIITASGLGKQYLVPGWRLGWIVFQDNQHGSIQEVKRGAQRLAQVILGSCHLAQVAIEPALNTDHDQESTKLWKKHLYSTIEMQAKVLCDMLNDCHGLDVIFPNGAMYAMVRIQVDMFDDHITDDVSFMKLLLEEENVVVLPGCAFGLDASSGYVFRVVFCAPQKVLKLASERISSFCLRHRSLV